MSIQTLPDWLRRLGYADEEIGLHLRGERLREGHPYSLEIEALLKPDGAIRARAVFDIEGVPTVVFFANENGTPLSAADLDALRQRIWNQNLASIVFDICGTRADVFPSRKLADAVQVIKLEDAQPDGPFSAFDVANANLSRRLPAWFDVDARVDRKLLANVSEAVKQLTQSGFRAGASEKTARRKAELLMGQVLFISYLEHRKIIGDTYKQRRNVQSLHHLIAQQSRDGIDYLVDCLREDFNGDFLGDDRHDPWAALNNSGFKLLDRFLRQTNLKTGQGEFWNYDFNFIPVELLSGLYESFLSEEEREKDGAYYTPRHLAIMAVDQAFAASPDPLSETVFDGACGSGILLTTAYRRLIALVEARQGQQLSFKDRRALLLKHIFGADTNFMACRVTAFSLYLSLMEGLSPADIMEAQDRDKVKLPSLAGSNLHHGEEADFFSEKHAFLTKRFSLVISNPPWTEPSGKTVGPADAWASRVKAPFVRRQSAGAFAIRALEFLGEGGRICLILPIPLFLAPTSAPFVSHFFKRVQPHRLINFGDLQNLLFPSAELTCHILVGVRRDERAPILSNEAFDYCVPKADLSLAYGRLTMQSADRHAVATRDVLENPRILVTLMWGDPSDLCILTRLGSRGTFSDMWGGPAKSRRWVCRKGVHFEDASREPVSAHPLKNKPFVLIPSLRTGSPVLHDSQLGKWPKERNTVASLGNDLLAVFDGPRVLFPDGFSRGEQNVRAVYLDGWASFNHSIGVIAGPKRDAALLQFATIYLRSSLARYFLMMRGWKMLCERNGVHLSDIEDFPFFEPDDAPNPAAAHEAIQEISKCVKNLARGSWFGQAQRYEAVKGQLDEQVFKYFDLSSNERSLVRETVGLLMPSIRPRSFKSLDTPTQKPATAMDFKRYAKTLANSLTDWRKATGGIGQFDVSVVASGPQRPGGVGVVSIKYSDAKTAPATSETQFSDDMVLATVKELRSHGLLAVSSGDMLQLVPDIQVWAEGALYIVRPLQKKSWTFRRALRDAEQIVRRVQKGHTEGPSRPSEVA